MLLWIDTWPGLALSKKSDAPQIDECTVCQKAPVHLKQRLIVKNQAHSHSGYQLLPVWRHQAGRQSVDQCKILLNITFKEIRSYLLEVFFPALKTFLGLLTMLSMLLTNVNYLSQNMLVHATWILCWKRLMYVVLLIWHELQILKIRYTGQQAKTTRCGYYLRMYNKETAEKF